MNKQHIILSQKQHGATLVVALVILLVMTVIGVSTMKSSTLQERMAGNARQKVVSQQAALAAVRAAELYLNENIDTNTKLRVEFTTSKPGLFSPAHVFTQLGTNLSLDVTDPGAWVDNAASTLVIEGDNRLDSTLVSRQPQFVIEYMGRDPGVTSSNISRNVEDTIRRAGSNTTPHMFRITAIGWGLNQNIFSIVESTYRTGYGVDASNDNTPFFIYN